MESNQPGDVITTSVNPYVMNARKSFLMAFWIVLSMLFVTCSNDEEDEFSPEGTNLSVNDIAGNWIATYAVFSNSQIIPPVMVNVLDEGGTVSLSIQTNGRFTFTISFPGESPDVTTGKLGFDEDYLVISYDDDPGEYEYMGIQSNANHSQLFISGPSTYDFDDNGTEEPAQLSLELVRN